MYVMAAYRPKRTLFIFCKLVSGKGTVEFKAWLYKLSSSDDVEYMHEISEFVRIQSR